MAGLLSAALTALKADVCLHPLARYAEAVASDERIEALTIGLELTSRDIRDLRIAAQQDGENIRAPARIAEIHERRLTPLEGRE